MAFAHLDKLCDTKGKGSVDVLRGTGLPNPACVCAALKSVHNLCQSTRPRCSSNRTQAYSCAHCATVPFLQACWCRHTPQQHAQLEKMLYTTCIVASAVAMRLARASSLALLPPALPRAPGQSPRSSWPAAACHAPPSLWVPKCATWPHITTTHSAV